MRGPAVTVLLPTYDRAAFVSQAVESVLGQRAGDLELIVIDDGSTDDTAAALARFQDSRLRVLHRPHRGISASLNAGLTAARGRFVARVDSDDVWLPDMLSATLAALVRESGAGVAYGRAQAMDRRGRPVAAVFGATRGRPEWFAGEPLRSLLHGDFTCNVALLARRACFERAGGYDETLPAGEDWDMWLRVARHFRFSFVDRVLARYRLHPGNLTAPGSTVTRAHAESRVRVLDKAFADPELPPEIAAGRGECYRRAHAAAAHRLLSAGEVRRALDAARRAVAAGGQGPAAVVRTALEVIGPAAALRAMAGRVVRW